MLDLEHECFSAPVLGITDVFLQEFDSSQLKYLENSFTCILVEMRSGMKIQKSVSGVFFA